MLSNRNFFKYKIILKQATLKKKVFSSSAALTKNQCPQEQC